ncbi:MAG: D-alanine--D-alanine ligase family protein [Streptosporangiaceae bacterium]
MDESLDGIRVAVACGGPSAEAEVSRASGRMVAEALERSGAKVHVAEPDATLVDLLRAAGVDVVFPALHGPLGEDGCLQGLLEYHRVPYVGSGVCASACANDKIVAKRLFRDAGLPIARDVTVRRGEDRKFAGDQVRAALGDDVVVKPARQGSAIGVQFAGDAEGLDTAMEDAFALDDALLVEERVEGKEITAGILDLGEPRPLPLIDIRTPPNTWYDYEHRYTPGLYEHVIPAPLSDDVYRRVQETAVAAHALLGCRHLSRADLVVRDDGRVVLLEVNTMPGMTPTSLYPDAARHAGYTFEALVTAFVRDALTA